MAVKRGQALAVFGRLVLSRFSHLRSPPVAGGAERHVVPRVRWHRLIIFGALVGAFAPAAWAQNDAANEAAWRAELEAINAQIEVTEQRQREIEAEIADVEGDRARLNRELIETNTRVQDLEQETADTERQMQDIIAEEGRLRATLGERREVLAEVLGVLQRMGREPPPAIIVQPGDALAAVRSAILLGAVVPELRDEATALAADIDTLVALRAERELERAQLLVNAQALAEESRRLELLIAERQEAIAAATETLATEQARGAGLAAQAGTLEELIAAIEPPAPAAEPVAPLALVDPGPPILLGPADRIAPAIPFASARGRLPRPVAGSVVAGFGAPDGFGGRTAGVSIETRAGARVSAPADGWVEFSGPFRSYGNVLIINAGEEYLIVLAGLDRIEVQLGQFVLAGEPVGAMPATQMAGAGAMGTDPPVLYVEFRRGGDAIDPGPWWADPY